MVVGASGDMKGTYNEHREVCVAKEWESLLHLATRHYNSVQALFENIMYTWYVRTCQVYVR